MSLDIPNNACSAVNMLTAVILITAIPLFLFGPIFFTRMSLYVTVRESFLGRLD